MSLPSILRAHEAFYTFVYPMGRGGKTNSSMIVFLVVGGPNGGRKTTCEDLRILQTIEWYIVRCLYSNIPHLECL